MTEGAGMMVIYYIECADATVEQLPQIAGASVQYFENEADARDAAIDLSKLSFHGEWHPVTVTVSRVSLKDTCTRKGIISILNRNEGFIESTEALATYTDGKADK